MPCRATRAPGGSLVTSRLVALVLLLVLVACFVGCGGGGDPVREAIDDVVKAAGHRDADDVAKRLAPGFHAADGSDREAALRVVKQYLGAYRSLDVELSKWESVRQGSSARAKFRIRMTGVPIEFGGLGDLVPRSATYDFDVGLAERDGTWQLVDAGWKDAAAGDSAPSSE
jgi:hypothetical protein